MSNKQKEILLHMSQPGGRLRVFPHAGLNAAGHRTYKNSIRVYNDTLSEVKHIRQATFKALKSQKFILRVTHNKFDYIITSLGKRFANDKN